jgi:hypothetical protein
MCQEVLGAGMLHSARLCCAVIVNTERFLKGLTYALSARRRTLNVNPGDARAVISPSLCFEEGSAVCTRAEPQILNVNTKPLTLNP